jgi:hypothetical protein
MNDRAHARAHNPVDTVVKAYERALRAEEKRPDTKEEGAKGPAHGARRRACEAVAENMGYAGWRVVLNIIERHDAKSLAKLETFGMALDPEFSRGVRLIQDSVDKLLEACDLISDAAEIQVGVKPGEDTENDICYLMGRVRKQLEVERPGILCPFCKGVVDDCPECDGDGWWDSLEGLGEVDPRLTDDENIHVQVTVDDEPVVVTLDAFEEGL